MAADFELNNYEFIQWDGPAPLLPREHIETFVRPGVDGVGLRKVGNYGNPFGASLHSVFADYATALGFANTYYDLTDVDPVKLTYNSTDYEAGYAVRFAVIDVNIRLCESRALVVGKGFAIVNAGYVITDFVFQPVRI